MKNGSNECEDIDECTERMHNCFGNSMKCMNTIGSFHCVQAGKPVAISQESGAVQCANDQIYDFQLGKCIFDNRKNQAFSTSPRRALNCRVGERIVNGECHSIDCGSGFFFNLTENRCQDVNECLMNNPCKVTERCTNTIGSYRCTLRCNKGYRPVAGGLACEDIDECALATYTCPPNRVCLNGPGSYQCQCPTGYFSLNGDCQDIDECSVGADMVCPDSQQMCINTPGSFRCECKEGYIKQENEEDHYYNHYHQQYNQQCIDIDECNNSTLNQCQHLCYNYAGSYKCACKSGYQLAPDGYSCEDIDECIYFQNSNLKSKYHQSANETEMSEKQVCYFKCINLPGSFRCICPPGYESLSGGQACKDIDECESNLVCNGLNEYCLNVRGSYRCYVINCPEGYFLEINSRK